MILVWSTIIITVLFSSLRTTRRSPSTISLTGDGNNRRRRRQAYKRERSLFELPWAGLRTHGAHLGYASAKSKY
ncbi:hypothetical protein BJX70DRAFT_385137 [Aspergillus crustosus]